MRCMQLHQPSCTCLAVPDAHCAILASAAARHAQRITQQALHQQQWAQVQHSAGVQSSNGAAVQAGKSKTCHSTQLYDIESIMRPIARRSAHLYHLSGPLPVSTCISALIKSLCATPGCSAGGLTLLKVSPLDPPAAAWPCTAAPPLLFVFSSSR
jgi:hypothetical protein